MLVGFLTGVGIQVAMGQLGGMLGVSSGTGGTIRKFVHTLGNIGETSMATLAVSISVIAVIVGGRLISKRIPGALIAVIGSIFVSWYWNLADHGVSTLGAVPRGLPSIGLPDVSWGQLPPLATTALAMFVVILAQSAATSRAYAAKYQEPFYENVDLLGLSVANVSAGLSGAFVVNGSPTKTQMVDSAGGRTPAGDTRHRRHRVRRPVVPHQAARVPAERGPGVGRVRHRRRARRHRRHAADLRGTPRTSSSSRRSPP